MSNSQADSINLPQRNVRFSFTRWQFLCVFFIVFVHIHQKQREKYNFFLNHKHPTSKWMKLTCQYFEWNKMWKKLRVSFIHRYVGAQPSIVFLELCVLYEKKKQCSIETVISDYGLWLRVHFLWRHFYTLIDILSSDKKHSRHVHIYLGGPSTCIPCVWICMWLLSLLLPLHTHYINIHAITRTLKSEWDTEKENVKEKGVQKSRY